MAHQSLYRKYRPQRFEDVVGQSHVTRTLRHAVADGTVAHAYLFTGPRGTGKTTTARILAKALDCEKGPTPDFDDTCEDCRAIAEGRHPDVYELDAASRTGVDDVREEIIGRVNYAATRGKTKVYIIDEVHMLSKAAFNALLKTLEEPPTHVVFVLATTDPHKVPETIRSRCQRFDFHRIGVEDIAERLAVIADKEGIHAAEGSLALIARHAGGGLRDAIGILEQLSAFTGKSISLDDVEGLLGEVDTALLFEVADLVAVRDVAGCFRFAARLADSGTDLAEFVRRLTGHFRDLYVLAAAGEADGVVDGTADELARLRAQSQEFGTDRLARVLDLLGELATDLRRTPDARLALEVALTRIARPQGDLTLEALAERVAALEAGAPAAAAAAPMASWRETAPRPATAPAQPNDPVAGEAPAAPPAPPATADGTPAVAAPGAVSAPAGPLDRARAKRAWPAVLAEMKKGKVPRHHAFIGTEVDVDGDTLVVEFARDQAFAKDLASEPDVLRGLRTVLTRVLGADVPVRYQVGRGGVHAEDGGHPAQDVPVDTPPVREEASPPRAAAAAGCGLDEIIDDLGAETIAEYAHEEDGRESG